MSNEQQQPIVPRVDTPIPTNSPQVDTARILSIIDTIYNLMNQYDYSENTRSTDFKKMLSDLPIDVSSLYDIQIRSNENRYGFLGNLNTLLANIKSICEPNRTETMQKLPDDPDNLIQ